MCGCLARLVHERRGKSTMTINIIFVIENKSYRKIYWSGLFSGGNAVSHPIKKPNRSTVGSAGHCSGTASDCSSTG